MSPLKTEAPATAASSRPFPEGIGERLPGDSRLSPSALVFLRGADADGRVAGLVGERRALRPRLGALAAEINRRRAFEQLGFRSLGDYARERLGVTSRVMREWARVSDLLGGLPCLRAAVLAGEVSWSVARRVVAHVLPEHDGACTASVRGRTVAAVEAMLRAALGDDQGAMPDEKEDRVRITLALCAANAPRWHGAIELARRMAGEALPVWECAEVIAAEALSALPPDVVSRAAPAEPAAPHAAPERKPAGSASSPANREHGLRHEAFPLLRWQQAGRAVHAPGDAAASPRDTSPHALDAAMRSAIRNLQRIDHDLGLILRQVSERRLYRELGFPSFDRYVQERVDVSPRTARRWVRLARIGVAAPAVARALRGGEITAMQAVLVAETVRPETAATWVTHARGVTLRRLEQDVAEARRAEVVVTFTSPRDSANVFLLAVAAAKLHLAEHQLAEGQLAKRDGKAVRTADALSWMLGHAIAAWQQQGTLFRDYADFERDGFRCTVPGCSARRSLQSHHVVFRSAGGPDEPWNRTTLCAFHHHRGVHARTISVRGRAPDGLVFALGIRNDGSPLIEFASGDRILGCPS